jgi:LysR family glycine cleavage system transcriptional activator
VLRFPLLHLDDRKDWSRWLEAAGASGEGLLHGPILDHTSMLIDAAIDGYGIALARTVLAATDLLSGRDHRRHLQRLKQPAPSVRSNLS